MLKTITIFLLFSSMVSYAEELETVQKVNLKQYMGTWFEIAAIPQSFQKDCASSTQAEYNLLEDGLVQVINSCEKKDGSIKSAEGRARIEDKNTSAKLKVTFVKLHDWIFRLGGDYWIIDLANDYSYAVVGHPKRTYGWILSRTTSLPEQTLNQIESRLRSKGYDTCQFITTKQSEGLNENLRLCDLSP